MRTQQEIESQVSARRVEIATMEASALNRKRCASCVYAEKPAYPDGGSGPRDMCSNKLLTGVGPTSKWAIDNYDTVSERLEDWGDTIYPGTKIQLKLLDKLNLCGPEKALWEDSHRNSTAEIPLGILLVFAIPFLALLVAIFTCPAS